MTRIHAVRSLNMCIDLTKNDHFQAMLKIAKERAFTLSYVCFNSWYSSLQNLKLLRKLGRHWLTRLKGNRLINPDGTGNRAVADCAIRNAGTQVHLKAYGLVVVFRIDTQTVTRNIGPRAMS